MGDMHIRLGRGPHGITTYVTPDPPSPTPTRRPVTMRRAHPLAWALALVQADGNPRRIQVHGDGSTTVHNTERQARRAAGNLNT